MTMPHPIQSLEPDPQGRLRFKANAIVKYLLEKGPFDMNHLAAQGFTQDDQEQFAQLIGYSLSGFGTLSYVSSETLNAATKMQADGVSEVEARNTYLRETLDGLKQALRAPVVHLFGLHPDDLGS